MSLYNALFGMNPQADFLLAVVGLRQSDIERFRDVHGSADGAAILVHTRTGGGNREDYPQAEMRSKDEWVESEDDGFDSTYCTDKLSVPEQWRADVVALGDVLANGLRKEFGQHLAKTLARDATPGDLQAKKVEQERAALGRTQHRLANGHTFVPYNDSAMQTALEIAEKNDNADLVSNWGILPLRLTVHTNSRLSTGSGLDRVRIDYEWKIDTEYWAHCREVFGAKYPRAMAKVQERVDQHLEQEKRP